jgi:hypothetical protein
MKSISTEKSRLTLKQFFNLHKIPVHYVATLAVMNRSLLHNYISGVSKPSNKQLKRIELAIHKLSDDIKSVKLIIGKNEF